MNPITNGAPIIMRTSGPSQFVFIGVHSWFLLFSLSSSFSALSSFAICQQSGRLAPTAVKKVIIHTDGACQGNPGPGGWAAVLQYGVHRKEISGADAATTNNRMELQAAISALSTLKERCEIELFTDSEYVKNGITAWVASWKRRGWRTVDKKPVKNDDLWRQLDAEATRHAIHWKWLKGHAGHPENERCDQLAVAEIEKLRKQYTSAQLKERKAEFNKSRDPNAAQEGLF